MRDTCKHFLEEAEAGGLADLSYLQGLFLGPFASSRATDVEPYILRLGALGRGRSPREIELFSASKEPPDRSKLIVTLEAGL